MQYCKVNKENILKKKDFPYILEDYQKIIDSQEVFKIINKNDNFIQLETKFGDKLFQTEDIINIKKEEYEQLNKTRYFKVNIKNFEDFPYLNSLEEYKNLQGKILEFDKFINSEIIQLKYKNQLEELEEFIFNIWDVEEIDKDFKGFEFDIEAKDLIIENDDMTKAEKDFLEIIKDKYDK